jgi:hypothetical protein
MKETDALTAMMVVGFCIGVIITTLVHMLVGGV